MQGDNTEQNQQKIQFYKSPYHYISEDLVYDRLIGGVSNKPHGNTCGGLLDGHTSVHHGEAPGTDRSHRWWT